MSRFAVSLRHRPRLVALLAAIIEPCEPLFPALGSCWGTKELC